MEVDEKTSLMALDSIELRGIVEKLEIMNSRNFNNCVNKFGSAIESIEFIIRKYEIKIDNEEKK